MPLRSTKPYARTLTAATAALLLIGSIAHSEPQKVNPLAKFAGNWLGNGLIYLSSGNKERIRCRGGFTPGESFNGSSLKLELRCAGDSYTFELQSELIYEAGQITGLWSEVSRGLNGKVMGTIKDDQVQAQVESANFTATLELISLGDKQQIRITSPGSEMTDVLIGLVRSGTRPSQPAPQQQQQAQ